MIDLRRSGRIPRRPDRVHRGFTLVEMLIAATIFSIIMIGYAGLFNYAIRSWRTTVTKMTANQNVQGASDRMTIDLRAALPPYTEAVDGDGDRIGFLGYDASSRLPLTNSQGDEIIMHCADYSSEEGSFPEANYGNEIQRRGYWLRRSGTTDTRIVYGAANGQRDDPIDEIDQGFSSQNDFAYRVNGFNVEYYNGTSWSNTWNSQSAGRLPTLIRISMEVIQNGSAKTLVLVTRPYATGTEITQ